ncbi:MAG TPA: YdiU family protein, partial [Polyangiales bacterium]|nr:YdiU family protein [Polyangiales bacterium]
MEAAATAKPEFAQVFGGNALLQGMEPFAACYGGHQFGTWAGQLGDGRAISLGEVLHRGKRWELQLKGAGRTPYSRGADGRAVLRSSIREFICSEAMHHLGVPTTRALSLVSTGDAVVRDMLYDGHPREEPGAIVCRVAPSFVRFGNFEIFASRGQHQLLQQLLDYVLTTHFPELGAPSPAVYAAWLAEVARRTGELIAEWMRVGFTHGVMNTDNLSVLGLTIDYGPFGFLDNFDPNFTPNTTDAERRRYRYGQQPRVARWNLSKLAEALYPLIREVPPLEAALDVYEDTFLVAQRRTLAAKLGLRALAAEDDGEAEAPTSDTAFVQALFELLAASETDFTLFFQGLAQLELPRIGNTESVELLAPLLPAYYSSEALPRDVQQRTLQ